MGLRPCLRQSSSTINSWWRTWLSWSSCRPNLQHEFAALPVLYKVFHVGWTDLRLASTTALTTSAATATRLFLSTTLQSTGMHCSMVTTLHCTAQHHNIICATSHCTVPDFNEKKISIYLPIDELSMISFLVRRKVIKY